MQTGSRAALAANLLRLRGGRSVVEVATAAGIHADTLYKLERGERWIADDTLDRLAKVLGATPDSLLRPPGTR